MQTSSNAVFPNVAEGQVWLVKVPTFLGKRWRDACDNTHSDGDRPQLGTIEEVSTAQGQGRSLRLKLSGPDAEGIPTLYNLRTNTGDTAGLQVFSEAGQHADLLGPVSQRVDAEIQHGEQPGTSTGVQLDASYRALSQHRHQEANTRTRTAQQVNPQDILNAQRAARLREPASMKSAIKRNADARNARANQVKLDADQLERLLFQLFEQKPSWKMNDLRAETRQSVESIKKVLEKIAVQITRGITRGEYELRTEYRTTEPSAMQTS